MKDTDLQKILDGLTKIENVFGCSLVEWRHIIQDATTFWTKCPYQIGQAVQLTKTPEISRETSWGWLGAKHFLIKGAAAHIVTREFYGGRFIFGLHFQDESWKDFEGKLHPSSEKGLYCFGEDWIEAFEEKRYTEDF